MKNTLVIFIVLCFLTIFGVKVFAEAGGYVQQPKGLELIQNTIVKMASLHGNDVRVEWSRSSEDRFTATIYLDKFSREIIFSKKEIDSADKNDSISSDTINRIKELVSQLPPRKYPPAMKP